MNLSKLHEKTKMHIINHTAYHFLGNVDVCCALDETRGRQVQQHNQNGSRYSRILEYHISLAVFRSAQALHFQHMTNKIEKLNFAA